MIVERFMRNLPLLGFRLLSGILESGTAAVWRDGLLSVLYEIPPLFAGTDFCGQLIDNWFGPRDEAITAQDVGDATRFHE